MSYYIHQAAPDMSLPKESTISILEYADVCRNTKHIQLDVRSITQFEMLSFNWYENKKNNDNNTNLINNEGESIDSKTADTNDVLKNGNNNSKIGSFVRKNVTVVHFPLSEIRKSDAIGVQNEMKKRMENIRNEEFPGSDEKEYRDEDSGSIPKDISETVIYCICRRGFDSTLSTQLLLKMGFSNVINVSGGITAWSASVDTLFPAY